MKMLRSVIDWLEERTGIESAIHHFLYEDVPASAGWHQVLGSVAMFAFLTQVFTGILLALNYAATPGEAYNSLRYIVTELTGGQIIRGLHHWGASLMIIVVVLHMVQVFLWGAYKKPREATWMVGALLLLLTLAYGLTGYLLPWDNRAYWATTVTVHISALPPVAGPYVLRLLGSDGGSIGAVTFARFYAAHVLLLPPLTFLLIAIHVYLVRRHGVPDDHALPDCDHGVGVAVAAGHPAEQFWPRRDRGEEPQVPALRGQSREEVAERAHVRRAGRPDRRGDRWPGASCLSSNHELSMIPDC